MATVIPVGAAKRGTLAAVTPASLAATMTIPNGPAHFLVVKNADTTHALTVALAPNTEASLAAGQAATWTVPANSTGYIALPDSTGYVDQQGALDLTFTPASGGALTGSTAHVLAAV